MSDVYSINPRNVFSGDFVNQFISTDEEDDENLSNREIEDNTVEVVEIDGELFLPLNMFEDLINANDKFKLIEFETKENRDDCKLNLKMSRFAGN